MSNPQEPEVFTPPEPETLEQTGLSGSSIEHLVVKILYFRGELYGQDLSVAIGLKFSVIQDTVETLKLHHYIQVKRSLGMGNVGAVLALTEAGRERAREYLEANQYSGPAPVPMEQYWDVVRRQKPREGWLTKESLARAFRGLVVTENLLTRFGPAVSSASSLLLYGKPGDGKTYMIEQLNNLDTQSIFLPFALECQGNIIQLYDPIYHSQIEEEQPSVLTVARERSYDRRWAKCKRPFIVSGGELSLDMLDLHYNHTSKIYEAPFQLKANNGIYLIDDFGRQRATPHEVLNRWIVPMERRLDYLSFVTGGKMTVPFETFLVFSTNLNPANLGDEAFLRRIQYKMLLRGPAENEFIRIFERYSASRGVPCPRELIVRFIDKYYRHTNKKFRRCQPRDLLTHAFNLIHFEKLPLRLTDSVLDRAFQSCFLEEDEDAAPPDSALVTMTSQSCQEYWNEQLVPVPTAFGKLAMVSSFRENGTGEYRHGEAVRQYGEAENAKVLVRMHSRLFREWLGLSLDQQCRDLERFVEESGDSKAAGELPKLLVTQPDKMESFAPPDAKPEEVRLFVQDFTTVFRLVAEDDSDEPKTLAAAADGEQVA